VDQLLRPLFENFKISKFQNFKIWKKKKTTQLNKLDKFWLVEGRPEDTWQGWYAVVEADWSYSLGMCEPEKGQDHLPRPRGGGPP